MSRCAICDYLQGYGSELHDEPNKWNKRVKWHSQYNEFQCTDCFNEIKELRLNYKQNEVTEHNESEQEDNSIPSTMPTL